MMLTRTCRAHQHDRVLAAVKARRFARPRFAGLTALDAKAGVHPWTRDGGLDARLRWRRPLFIKREEQDMTSSLKRVGVCAWALLMALNITLEANLRERPEIELLRGGGGVTAHRQGAISLDQSIYWLYGTAMFIVLLRLAGNRRSSSRATPVRARVHCGRTRRI